MKSRECKSQSPDASKWLHRKLIIGWTADITNSGQQISQMWMEQKENIPINEDKTEKAIWT